MIESIFIRNFQKHGKFDLKFERITTLCGPSDRGKSAVVRALRWACFNKPDGDFFVRDGESDCRVDLRVDGHTVSRHRVKGGGNLFKFNDKCFAAFGRDVPNIIKESLNLSEDSFQLQHDPAYWLTLSPGQVAKELNRVINLELIDRCQANISSELRKAKSVVEVTKDRLAAAKTEAEGLGWVREANKSFQTISDRQETTNAKLIKLDKLRQIQGEGQNYAKTLQNAANVKCGDLMGCLEKIIGIKTQLVKLHDVQYQVANHQMMCKRLKNQLLEAKKNLKTQMKGKCPICGGKVDTNIGSVI